MLGLIIIKIFCTNKCGTIQMITNFYSDRVVALLAERRNTLTKFVFENHINKS